MNDIIREEVAIKSEGEPPNILADFPEGFRDHISDYEALFEDVETEDLLAIRKIISGSRLDEEFRESLDNLRNMMPEIFHQMVNLEQNSVHMDIDPLDHTINALRLLNTSEMNEEDREMARVILLFHDIGKVVDPTDRDHPKISALLAPAYLEGMGYSPEQIDRILMHIARHDALGEVTRRDGQSIYYPTDVENYFEDVRDLDLHRAVAVADVGSIRGLEGYVPELEATYRALRKRLELERGFIKIRVTEELPFEYTEGDYDDFQDIIYGYGKYKERLHPYNEDEDIDYEKDRQERKKRFEALDQSDQDMIEKTLVAGLMQNREEALVALRSTGRETDLVYIDELEEKYGVDLESGRVAVHLFRASYAVWEARRIAGQIHTWSSLEGLRDGSFISQIKKLKVKLNEIKTATEFLSKYQLEATHAADRPTLNMMQRDGVIYKSSGDQYEGDGVYLGIFGSYRGWKSEGKGFKIWQNLADGLPIIVNYNSPNAMINVTCEMLDIEGSDWVDFYKEDQDLQEDAEIGKMAESFMETSVSHGIRGWYHANYSGGNVPAWKKDLVAELIDAEVKSVRNKHGDEILIADTLVEPIVWSYIMKALNIKAFYPMREFRKADLDWFDRTHHPEVGSWWLYEDYPGGIIEVEDPEEEMVTILEELAYEERDLLESLPHTGIRGLSPRDRLKDVI